MTDWPTAPTSDMTTPALCRTLHQAFMDLPDTAIISLAHIPESPRLSIKVGDLRQMAQDTQKLTCLWTEHPGYSAYVCWTTACGREVYATKPPRYCHLCGNRCEQAP